MRQKSSKSEVLSLLLKRNEEYLSGQQIGDALGLSRTAVWKAVNSLKEDGLHIESSTRLGYRLLEPNRAMTQELVEKWVHEPCELHVVNKTGSTNDDVKAADLGARPLVICANQQTKGRGRMGRPFISPAGTGIYISFGIRPRFDISQSLFVTMAAAVAMCRAIKTAAGVTCGIKWVNDLFLNGKKICGILTEGETSLETGSIDKLVIGIGVNCFPGSIPEDLEGIAGTISESCGEFSRARLAAEITNKMLSILDQVEDRSFLDEYREHCFILGKQVFVHPTLKKEGWAADALDVTEDGGLLVRYLEGPKKGRTEAIHTGELSIRPL
ncbi:MAG: biotin--[acetyl-CoA-carboxylase] ligase [Eubacteriales bacterium]|nr:biotin--[acetyl-CoA-carboxylase] ligase [Eubacteriales bacterium]